MFQLIQNLHSQNTSSAALKLFLVKKMGMDKKEEEKKEPFYIARPEYLEECTFIVIVWMLERLPRLKMRVRKYLEAFPE